MLSQSSVHKEYWELFCICLFAKTPRQGIAPNIDRQQWILILVSTLIDHMVFQTGEAEEDPSTLLF
jgi:hypothetical protein